MSPTGSATTVMGGPGDDQAAILADRLGRRYGDVTAVESVSLAIRPGEFFALLGPNGAGKTTTLHMLTTMVRPTSGTASVFGFDVVRQPHEVRRLLGMVFQDPALDDRLTARENLEIHAVLYGIGRKEREQVIERALEWAALTEARDRRVRSFSGGMKRRLELARALTHSPKVLFLDEPTIGLDPQGRRNLWEHIDALREGGMTVLMTTHNLPEAEACDRVGIMDAGRLVAVGTPRELVARHGGGADGDEAGDGGAEPGAVDRGGADRRAPEPAPRGADLEDVLIALTGKQLRDEQATARDRLVSFAKRGGEHTR
ncbi:MAG: ATP-binding cassette domain-containing protein [Trueperaceae bacterium]|nr:ATP-binding cassette domain-containing protein [Trueperaceae bacterium]MCO5173645.1 ATP-binding cassette domain-containing protein [Trueperaceae bacterium]MCW5820581.1 ATP-binding cassette domain-containing protein [Trueperaceae bacterium]